MARRILLRLNPSSWFTISRCTRVNDDMPGWLITTLLVIAESALVYLFAGSLVPTYQPPYAPPAAWALVAIMLSCTAFARFIERQHFPRTSEEPILWLGLAILFLLSTKLLAFSHQGWTQPWPRALAHALIFRSSTADRPVWGVVALVAYTWWRGRTRALPDTESTYEQFRLGIGALIIGLILALTLLPQEAVLRRQLPAVVLWYILASLAAISLARLRIEALRASAPLSTRSWLIVTVLALAAVLLVTTALAILFTRQALALLWLLSLPILWAVALLVQAVLLLVAALAFLLLLPLLWLLEHQRVYFTGSGRLSSVLDALSRAERFTHMHLTLADPARYLVAGAVLILLGSWLVRRVFRRQWRWRQIYPVAREPLPVMRTSLKRLGQRLTRLLGRLEPDPLDALRHDSRWQYTVQIRLRWRQLLEYGQALGLPAQPAQTPSEYAALLAQHFPGTASALDRFTAVYLAARYRPEPATADLAAAAEQAWQELHHIFAHRTQ